MNQRITRSVSDSAAWTPLLTMNPRLCTARVHMREDKTVAIARGTFIMYG